MNKNKQETDIKTLLGIPKKPLSTKPKEERIMEAVDRMIHRIQLNEGN